MISRSKPIARSTRAIPKKRKVARKFKTPRCDVRRCTKAREVVWVTFDFTLPHSGPDASYTQNLYATTHQMCKPHAKARADTLFSLFIRQRDGECRIRTDSPCVGPLSCCHLLSRQFLATRWDERNAVAGCAGHHAYWTRNPDRWAAFLEDYLAQNVILDGAETLASLRSRAFNGEPQDLATVLAALAGVK